MFQSNQTSTRMPQRVILPGKGRDIESWAEVFCRDRPIVPVFLKRGTNRWEYVGQFQPHRRSADRRDIASHQVKARRDDVSQVLWLKEVSEEERPDI